MEWQTTTLGIAYDVRDGTHDSPKYQDSGYPLVTSKNLKPAGLNFEKVKYISDVDFKKINERSGVHKGDVLFAMIGTIGNPIIVDVEPNFAIKNVALFKVSEGQDGKFLKYYLESSYVIEKMAKEAKGTTQKFVGLGYLRQFPIVLPPIPEQKRIVAILDQAFAEIDKARANAEQNLKNARELFESYLQQVFSQRGEGWSEYELKDVVNLKSGTTVKKEYERNSGDVAYIKVSGMSLDGNEVEITTSNMFLNKEDINSNNILPVGTTIFPKRGGAIATNKKRITAIPLCIDLNTMGVIPRQEVILPLYIYFYFKTFDLITISNGTTIPQINNYSFDGLKIILPSIERQESAIKKMYAIEAKTNGLNLIYAQKLNDLDELKKSILQKAFTGEFTNNQSKGVAA